MHTARAFSAGKVREGRGWAPGGALGAPTSLFSLPGGCLLGSGLSVGSCGCCGRFGWGSLGCSLYPRPPPTPPFPPSPAVGSPPKPSLRWGSTQRLAPGLGAGGARILPAPFWVSGAPQVFPLGAAEPPQAVMELPWLKLLAQPCRLLLHALASGPSGTLAALRVLQRVQTREEPGGFSWQGFTAALCMEEPTLEGPEEALAV